MVYNELNNREIQMLEYILERLKELSTWKGLLAFISATLMYFCPKVADQIILALVASWGLLEIFRAEAQK